MTLYPILRDGALPFYEDELNGSIPDRLARVFTFDPDKEAIKSGDLALTYRQLDRVTGQLALAIRNLLGDGPEAVVFQANPGVDSIVAMLGIIRAGKYYCALNLSDPPDRGKAILADLKARLLLADNEHLESAHLLATDCCKALTLDEMKAGMDKQNLIELQLDAQTLAGISFSSGTTGEPKGIPRDHHGVLETAWVENQIIGIRPNDRVIMLRGLAFAASRTEVFGTLLNGATLYIYNVQKMGISALPEILINERITLFRPPLELLRFFLDNLEAEKFFPDVHRIVVGGDTVYKKDVERIRNYFPRKATIFNLLGASETGLLASLKIEADTIIDSDIVPVGYPVPGKEILILDQNKHKLGPDQIGDIAVRGHPMVLKKDHFSPSQQAQFIPDPDNSSRKVFLTGDLGRLRQDGMLELIGRKDLQFKIRDYRVNGPAVISKLMENDRVRHAVVTARLDRNGEKRLIAYLVAAPGKHPHIENLISELSKKLPHYMIPTAFVFVDRLPIMESGKVDFKALPDPDWSHPNIYSQYLSPRNDIEHRLVEIWQSVLRVEKVGIRDDFFALGGHSLSGAVICAQINKEYGKKLYPAALVEYNTVEKLYDCIKEQSILTKFIVPIRAGGNKPPLFLAPGHEGDTLYFRPLASHLEVDQPVYALQATNLEEVLGSLADLDEMASYYIKEMRKVQPAGPYYLAGHSFGGILVFAIAQLLMQDGEKVNLLALLDTFAPGQVPKAHFFERIQLHVNNLRSLKAQNWPSYFHQRYNNLIVRLSGIQPLRRFIHFLGLVPSDASSMNRIAALRYDYHGYPGKLVIFRVKDRPEYVRTDLISGWQKYAAEVEVHDVPGTHATLLNEPNVAVLAAKLAKCLMDSQANGQRAQA